MTPCEMLLYRLHTYRAGRYLSSSVALVRADNEASWLAYWEAEHPTGITHRAELVERYPAP